MKTCNVDNQTVVLLGAADVGTLTADDLQSVLKSECAPLSAGFALAHDLRPHFAAGKPSRQLAKTLQEVAMRGEAAYWSVASDFMGLLLWSFDYDGPPGRLYENAVYFRLGRSDLIRQVINLFSLQIKDAVKLRHPDWPDDAFTKYQQRLDNVVNEARSGMWLQLP